MATPNIVPRSDSEGGLGTASKYWASAYIDNVFVSKIGRDADNLLSFSTDNQIIFRVGTVDKLLLTSARLAPNANDGAALGSASLGWSDLFLAEGAVINFNNGDVTLTHATNNLAISGGNLQYGDNVKAAFGNAGDFNIYHDSTDSYIDNEVTGDLYIRQLVDGKDIIFQSDDGSGGIETYFFLDGSRGGANPATLFPDNSRLFFGNNEDLVLYHDGNNNFIQNQIGDLTIKNLADDKNIIFQSDDGGGGITEYFKVDGLNSRVEFSKNLKLSDSASLLVGSGHDLQLSHNSIQSFIINGTGDLTIRQNKENQDIIFQGDDGQASDNTVATYFSLDGSSATHDGSATTMLTTNWPDKSHITLGTSHDFHMYHTGSQTVISQQGEGNLTIQNTVNDSNIIFACDDGSGGTTEYFRLYGNHSGNPITQFPDNSQIHFGDAFDFRISHDGSQSILNNQTGNLEIVNNADDGDIIFKASTGTNAAVTYFRLDGGNAQTEFEKNAKFLDSVELRFGNSNDLKIHHDGSTSAFIHNNIGDLYIKNDEVDHDIYFQNDDGSGGLTNYLILDGGEISVDVITQKVKMPNLPTSDPNVAGQLYIDASAGRVLKVSAG